MGGKSSSITTGFWYKVAYHHGLAATPIDAFLEFRCADKTAWAGELTASGTIHINQPQLFGGEKDQGGIVGDVDVMFGEPTQQPNAYLAQAFGPQQPGWRGVTTLVFKGGRFGANNPYPQAPAYKIRCITHGWDGDPGDGSACWYPEKAAVTLAAATVLAPNADGWEYVVVPHASAPGYNALDIPTNGWLPAPPGPWQDARANHANVWWPSRSDIWFRRMISGTGAGQVCHVAADNGCVVFLNGALAGASNRANAPIPDNTSNPVTFPLASGQSYQLAVKVFCEENDGDDVGNVCSISVTAPGFVAMNAAHILYDLLTSADRGAEPTANIKDDSFRTGADWFFANGVGLCTNYDPDAETVEQCKARIEAVAGCSVSRSPVDGLWYLDIANGVYDFASLPILTDDDILEFAETPSTLDDAVNSLSAEYVDVQQKVTSTTPPVQALSLINANGLHHDVHQYHELPTSDLALRVIERDLAASITPTRVFNLTTTRKPFSWRTNTYFRLQTPKRGIADMVCILAEKSSGTLKSGAMTLTASEDIYSLPASSFVTAEAGVDTRPPSIPVAISRQRAFEAPYIDIVSALSRADLAALPTDAGFLETIALAPGNYPDYAVTVSVDDGVTYDDRNDARWCPSALIVEGDPLQDAAPATSFTLASTTLLDAVVVGSAALWDDEICRVDAIYAAAAPPTLTLGRGCADTVPAPHAANSRIWFYQGFAAADMTEYTDGEAIDVALLTNAGGQRLDPALATPIALTFDGRQNAPYAPGALQINGAWYPETFDGTILSSWATRNRLQQADQLIDTTAAAIQPEADAAVVVSTYAEDGAQLSTALVTAPPPFDATPAETVEDPLWSQVATLINFDGAQGSKTIVDQKGGAFTTSSSNASINTVNPIFPPNSDLLINSPGYVLGATGVWAPGAADWSVELFIRPSYVGAGSLVFDTRPSGNNGSSTTVYPGVGFNTSAMYIVVAGSGINFAHNGAIAAGQRALVEITRSGGNLLLFVNGNLLGTYTLVVGATFPASRIVLGISAYGLSSSYFQGEMDSFRVTAGTARHTASYVPAFRRFAQFQSVGTSGGVVRVDVGASRDGVASFQKHSITLRRAAYGYNYGMYYGGSTPHQRGEA